MPRAVAVRDLDEKSAAVWLEEVPTVPRIWTEQHLARAAYLLGRLAASPAVRELASDRREPGRAPGPGLLGRTAHAPDPADAARRGDLAAPAGRYRVRRRPAARLLVAADRLPDYVEEIEQMPIGASHGDACTNNILVRPDSDDLVLIDFGFWMPQPFGFDLEPAAAR